MRHTNAAGYVKEYDFSALPVAEPMQRSLARLVAAHCTPHGWSSHGTSKSYWEKAKKFADFLSGLEDPPRDLDGVTAAMVKRWRLNQPPTGGGFETVHKLTSLLRSDARLQAGPVADELAVRVRRPKSTTQSYAEDELEQIKLAARRVFRAALLRIRENTECLERWRAGEIAEGSQEWVIGEVLDLLARTGGLPVTVHPCGTATLPRRYRRALGGSRGEVTWQRLFLSGMEAAAMGVLLMAEYGWNLAVIDRAEVPRATPDPGEDGHPTYRIPLEKRRRGAGHHFETRNVTDDGASSPGRLISEVLEATRCARAVVEDLAPGTDLLVVWHNTKSNQTQSDMDRPAPVGRFHFGVSSTMAKRWGQAHGLDGSPFRRGRRTVNALDRRQPGQNTQETHDRNYVLVDKRVQAEAVEVIAAGAENAAGRAHEAVLVAELRNAPVPGDTETATTDCRDYDDGPFPAPEGGCGASFLMCLGCENARVHPGHHPRLAHFHRALDSLHSVLPPRDWKKHWQDAHTRLEDLKGKLGEGQWAQALDRVTDADIEMIDFLLTGDLSS
ncbi:hypothetical protein [Actinomadura violacea]|uniref:Integrase n=1 Tax=Actinomadura violacea TaxID=2819934 RepID=A0ABS3SB83_9ACTN|nr:hypothetical protein [Actinomadura violacea]MBO2466247.1 hypothetical protein [Actinomadura violacea]